jgi:hypothetical protein
VNHLDTCVMTRVRNGVGYSYSYLSIYRIQIILVLNFCLPYNSCCLKHKHIYIKTRNRVQEYEVSAAIGSAAYMSYGSHMPSITSDRCNTFDFTVRKYRLRCCSVRLMIANRLCRVVSFKLKSVPRLC